VTGTRPALVLLVPLAYARTHDGPIAILPGGPFERGSRYTGPEPDWSEMRTRGEVEFQLLDPPRSRITWIAEHENKIYIVSGYMNTILGRIWKQWPHEALKDPRVLLRIDDEIYARECDAVAGQGSPRAGLRALLRTVVEAGSQRRGACLGCFGVKSPYGNTENVIGLHPVIFALQGKGGGVIACRGVFRRLQVG